MQILCEQCEVSFRVEYEESDIDEVPMYCVFCGEYISDDREAPPSLRGFVDDDVEL